MPEQPTEIEAKFLLNDLEEIRRRVESLRGEPLTARTHEFNLRFDTPSGELQSSGVVLRLRQDADCRLTYKRPLEVFEERVEIEIVVDSFDRARLLLESLGYRSVFSYEKYRQCYRLGEARVMLDELPFGLFVEIEGPSKEALVATSEALGLSWENRVALTYMQIFAALQGRQQLAFSEATFAHFAASGPIDWTGIGLVDALLPAKGKSL